MSYASNERVLNCERRDQYKKKGLAVQWNCVDIRPLVSDFVTANRFVGDWPRDKCNEISAFRSFPDCVHSLCLLELKASADHNQDRVSENTCARDGNTRRAAAPCKRPGHRAFLPGQSSPVLPRSQHDEGNRSQLRCLPDEREKPLQPDHRKHSHPDTNSGHDIPQWSVGGTGYCCHPPPRFRFTY